MIFSDLPKYFNAYFAENQIIILIYNELLIQYIDEKILIKTYCDTKLMITNELRNFTGKL